MNTSPRKKQGLNQLATLVLGLLTIAYPFLVYFGINRFGVGYLAIGLLALMGVRLIFLRKGVNFKNQLFLLAALSLVSLLAFLRKDPRFFYYYPTLVSGLMCVIFGYTLSKPPSMIERFARLMEPEFPPEAVIYCRKVTMIWCGFFVVNGSIALVTALLGDIKIWTLYNGFISYLLMGLLFGIEYLVRRSVKRKSAEKAMGGNQS